MKKTYTLGASLLVSAVGIVLVIHQRETSSPMPARPAATHPIAFDAKPLWTCGMHPFYISDHPGTCPICHMTLTPMHRHTESGEPMRPGSAVVVLDTAVVQNMGVRTAQVTRGPLIKTVQTSGTLEAPEPGLHDISLKVSGWIEKLYANQEGQHVLKGDPLFEMYSPDLVVAGEELVGAVKAENAIGSTTDPALKTSAHSLMSSARKKLARLDVSEADIDAIVQTLIVPRTTIFRSPSSGAVIDKSVVEGSAVQPGTKLLRIEDHSVLWLDLDIYENQMEFVTTGQAVEATLSAYPGRTFHGKIDFVHPHVDHMSRTLIARAILDNEDLKLRPGMYASAEILTTPIEDAVQVPREAVIDTGTRQIVFVVQSAGHFEPRDVRMGITGSDGRVQIIDGLSAGETVVTSGQFLLDVESRTTEAIDKMRAASTPPATMNPAKSSLGEQP